MSQFIDPGDYDASIHREILTAVTRDDEAIVEICEDRAVEQLRSYMNQRYDCDRIFAARGEQRHVLVLMMALDIAVYHIFCIHNPQMLSQMRKDRYDRAVEWLKAVRKGDIVVDGLPSREDENGGKQTDYLLRSNPKRTNHI